MIAFYCSKVYRCGFGLRLVLGLAVGSDVGLPLWGPHFEGFPFWGIEIGHLKSNPDSNPNPKINRKAVDSGMMAVC